MIDREQLIASIKLSPIASLVTDLREDDNPIVGVNEAFCDLTGYNAAEVIGRNCRLLSGPGTETEARRVLQEAIAAGQPALTELTNYKKDGTAFLNAVMMAPIKNEGGETTFFLGSQMEIHSEDRTETFRRQRSEALVASLTPRQIEVLALMTQGLRNKSIAMQLGIKEGTVKLHRSLVLKNLEANSPGDAVRIAIEAGLREVPERLAPA